MLKVIVINKENIKNETRNYKCLNDIYGLLLITGKYTNAKVIIHQTKVI